MGLFSCCFSQSTPKVGAESKPAIQKLKQWETTHFPIPRTYAWTNGSPNPATRYQIYRTEQGASISLKKMKIPAASSQSQVEFIFSKIKTITSGIDPNEVACWIFDYRTQISNEIQRFLENLQKLENLNKTLREDSLFFDIDHVFQVKVRSLYHELLFCKFENLGNAAYFQSVQSHLIAIHKDMNDLNTNFLDYMHALTNTEQEDTTQDLELIRMQVQAMAELTQKQIQDSYRGVGQ